MSQVKERPILFSAPMVRAILEGRKTVTRRVLPGYQVPMLDTDGRWLSVAQHHRQWGFAVSGETEGVCAKGLETSGCCPYGKPGERLWVRETWYCDHFEVMRGPYLKPDDLNVSEAIDDGTLVYAADGLTPYEADQPIWKPSIHMPRWASRILLEITDVRVERLQDISEEQALAEGIAKTQDGGYHVESGKHYFASPVDSFASLWSSVGGDWDANPWVWVVEFKRVTP